jgi:hypothetical protein
MKTLSMLVVGMMGVAMVGCAGETDDATPNEANDESEVVGTSSFPEIEKSFDLKAGTADQATLRSGDCYKAFVLPVEGIPTHNVKKFANGAIISPVDNSPNSSVCVDLYGANKISFSHTMLDAVVRFGLGRFEKKVVVPETAEGVVLHFANGLMRVFTGVPEARRFDNARKRPSDFRPGAAVGIAGSVVDITLKAVNVTNRRGERSIGDVKIPGELVGIAHRHAWQFASKKGAGTMTNDAIGTFTRAVFADAQENIRFYNFVLENGQLHYMSDGDATTKRESLRIFGTASPAEGEKPLVSCERSFAASAPPSDYTCSGL